MSFGKAVKKKFLQSWNRKKLKSEEWGKKTKLWNNGQTFTIPSARTLPSVSGLSAYFSPSFYMLYKYYSGSCYICIFINMTALQLYSTIFVSCGFLRLNTCDVEFYCFFKALLLTVASTCTHEQTHPHTWVLRKYKQTNNYAPGWVVHLFLSVLLVMRVVCPLVLSWPNPKEVRKCGSSRSIILPTPTLPGSANVFLSLWETNVDRDYSTNCCGTHS